MGIRLVTGGVPAELRILRISVARVAQTLGVHQHIPGCKEHFEAPYEVLSRAAAENERGWNALCEIICHEIRHLQVMAWKHQADKDDGPDDDGDDEATGQAGS